MLAAWRILLGTGFSQPLSTRFFTYEIITRLPPREIGVALWCCSSHRPSDGRQQGSVHEVVKTVTVTVAWLVFSTYSRSEVVVLFLHPLSPSSVAPPRCSWCSMARHSHDEKNFADEPTCRSQCPFPAACLTGPQMLCSRAIQCKMIARAVLLPLFGNTGASPWGSAGWKRRGHSDGIPRRFSPAINCGRRLWAAISDTASSSTLIRELQRG